MGSDTSDLLSKNAGEKSASADRAGSRVTNKGNVPCIGFKTRHDSTGSRVWDLHEFNPYPSSEFAGEVYGHAP